MTITPLRLLLTSLAFIISGCGSDSPASNDQNNNPIPDRESILGHWQLQFDNGCQESYGFSNDGELIVFSNQEYISADYMDVPLEQSRNALIISVLFDNGGTDCEGSSEDDSTAEPIEIYYTLAGNNMLWYDTPESTTALATLEFVPLSFNNHQSEGFSLTINSVSPSALVLGESTEVTVSISYSLPNLDDNYNLLIGTNKKFMNLIYADQDVELDQTSGQITVSVPTQAYDWGSENAFFLSAWIFKNKETALEQPVTENFIFDIVK